MVWPHLSPIKAELSNQGHLRAAADCNFAKTCRNQPEINYKIPINIIFSSISGKYSFFRDFEPRGPRLISRAIQDISALGRIRLQYFPCLLILSILNTDKEGDAGDGVIVDLPEAFKYFRF